MEKTRFQRLGTWDLGDTEFEALCREAQNYLPSETKFVKWNHEIDGPNQITVYARTKLIRALAGAFFDGWRAAAR